MVQQTYQTYQEQIQNISGQPTTQCPTLRLKQSDKRHIKLKQQSTQSYTKHCVDNDLSVPHPPPRSNNNKKRTNM